jgi:hypothetical protein
MNKILLLTGFTKNVFWDDYGNCDYGKLSALNHLQYATKHNYSYHCEIIEDFLLDRNQTWHKIQLIQKYLKIYDYVAWIDADAVFIKDDIKLEEFIDPSIDLILPEMQIDKRTGLQLTKTSTGFMIWKNCDWSFDLLNDMWNNSGDYAYGFFHEQSLLDTKISIEKESIFVSLNNVKIISEKYHNTDSELPSEFIYHAGGNTFTKFSRIKEQLNKIIQ